METISEKKRLLSAVLLVAGCCIGAGMIGLPVVSALAGFIPSTLAMLLCYFFATATGFLILEATLWFKEDVNLISMASFSLGRFGRIATWSLFLFLFYCIFVAYIEGGGHLFAGLLSAIFQTPVPREIGILVCVGFVGCIVYLGIAAVASVNRVFMFCLIGSYCVMIFFGLHHVTIAPLLQMNWKAILSTIPIMLVCFGYQNLIPTLTYYAKRNVNTLRLAILLGNALPFLVYLLWNFVILGILPEKDLMKIAGQSDMVTHLLEQTVQSETVLLSVTVFTFFALITPFMGNAMAFVDFMKDGLKIPAKSKYELLVYLLVLVPPTLITLIYPRLFLKALGLVGGFVDVLLFGILPVLIVWIGRYVKKAEGPYRVAGGKLFLGLLFFLSLALLIVLER